MGIISEWKSRAGSYAFKKLMQQMKKEHTMEEQAIILYSSVEHSVCKDSRVAANDKDTVSMQAFTALFGTQYRDVIYPAIRKRQEIATRLFGAGKLTTANAAIVAGVSEDHFNEMIGK